MTEEQLQTLSTFMGRWEVVNRKVNEGSYYQNYQIGNSQLHELVEGFTLEQKQFIQAQLNSARGVIGHTNILK